MPDTVKVSGIDAELPLRYRCIGGDLYPELKDLELSPHLDAHGRVLVPEPGYILCHDRTGKIYEVPFSLLRRQEPQWFMELLL